MTDRRKVCFVTISSLRTVVARQPSTAAWQRWATFGSSAGLAPCQAAASVAPVVQPANLNSPEQTVISGSKAAVERAAALCKEAGAKRAIMLPVSAPFHCKLMQPAEEQLANTLESIQFNDPAFPVAANVDARLLHRGPEVRDALIRQVTGAVRWVECIQLLKDSGATHFIEVGPGKVLQGLNHKIDKSLVTTHVESPETLAKAMAIFNT